MTTLDVLPDGSAIHDATDEGWQAFKDYRDGIALRRLREAMTKRGLERLESYGLEMRMTTGGTWRVQMLRFGSEGPIAVAGGAGRSFGEAADALREALG